MRRDNTLAKWLRRTRQAANMVNLGELDGVLQQPYDAQKLSRLAIKLPKLVSNIQATHTDNNLPTQKHYVYSTWKQKNRASTYKIEQLLDSLGYQKWNLQQSDVAALPDAKRYMSTRDWTDEGDTARDKALRAFNHPSNRNGRKIEIFLADGGWYYGLHFDDLRNIHILEPESIIKRAQTVGRAARFCSHAHLPRDEWFVDVYDYFARVPEAAAEVQQAVAQDATEATITTRVRIARQRWETAHNELIDYLKRLNLLEAYRQKDNREHQTGTA